MKLSYRQYSEAGQPLLVLHGLFGNLRNWNWHARELSRDFSVYALDLRNHGDSPHAETMSYPEMAEDILEFVDALELPAVYLLGHSMGGKVAMQMALTNPQRVNRLLVADIAPAAYGGERSDHDNVFNGLLAIDTTSLGSRNEAEQVLADHVKEPGVRQFLVSNLVRDERGGYRWRFNLAALRGNYEKLREGVNGVDAFDKPVLFIRGALSDYIKQQDWQQIQQLFPNARIKTMMGAGHWLHAEKPQVFYKLARDFFISEDIGQ